MTSLNRRMHPPGVSGPSRKPRIAPFSRVEILDDSFAPAFGEGLRGSRKIWGGVSEEKKGLLSLIYFCSSNFN